ncbi:MAG TPA: fasciclin domain-containing protein [Acidimicrobiia bacterium]|nr:fasciclin domain-containing protein [Acidimicrobiia bacterium]
MKYRSASLIVIVGLFIAACGEDAATEITAEMMDDTSTTAEMMDETTTAEMMDEDVLAVAAAEGDLDTFLGALEAAGIMEDFHGEGPFTLFIPTDDAFSAYVEEAGMTEEEVLAEGEMLQSVLGYHVVTMMEDSEMVMGMDGQTLTTLNGAPLDVTVDGETVMVGDATIVRYDLSASNGVIHVIDTVLIPPEA